VDNYVGNVYKGHGFGLYFLMHFYENTLKNKVILIKDIDFFTKVSRETCFL
jgi:hypothetical protein